VCAASDVHDARQIAPRLVRVVPGIRLPGAAVHDQARPASPREALDAGADVLVVGRAVTGAEDRRGAAAPSARSTGAGAARRRPQVPRQGSPHFRPSSPTNNVVLRSPRLRKPAGRAELKEKLKMGSLTTELCWG
jgi:hypothetical protein